MERALTLVLNVITIVSYYMWQSRVENEHYSVLNSISFPSAIL